MKATILTGGELLIEAETQLESYALQRWCDDLRADLIDGRNILTRFLIKVVNNEA